MTGSFTAWNGVWYSRLATAFYIIPKICKNKTSTFLLSIYMRLWGYFCADGLVLNPVITPLTSFYKRPCLGSALAAVCFNKALLWRYTPCLFMVMYYCECLSHVTWRPVTSTPQGLYDRCLNILRVGPCWHISLDLSGAICKQKTQVKPSSGTMNTKNTSETFLWDYKYKEHQWNLSLGL